MTLDEGCEQRGGVCDCAGRRCARAKHLTNSEMKQFRRCRRQWYLSVYRRFGKPSRFNSASSIGTRVHEALAAYYNPESSVHPVEYMRGTVAQDLAQHPDQEDALHKEADLVEAMLSGYMIWLEEEGKDAELELLEAEGARTARLDPQDQRGLGDVVLMAKLDARVRFKHDGVRRALEHKTVGDLSTPLAALQIDTQLLTEHLVEYLALLEEGKGHAEMAKGVLYNMLRKSKRTSRAKPPFYGREEVNHNVHELRSHWRHVTRQAQEILDVTRELDEGASHHDVCYPNPTRDCKWDCPFFAVCGLLDDGSDHEVALGDLFIERDPLERYGFGGDQNDDDE